MIIGIGLYSVGDKDMRTTALRWGACPASACGVLRLLAVALRKKKTRNRTNELLKRGILSRDQPVAALLKPPTWGLARVGLASHFVTGGRKIAKSNERTNETRNWLA